MPNTSLTARQQLVVQAIREWIEAHGYPPTIRELGRRLGIKSLRGVTTHLDAIAKKGALVRQRGARGIRLLLDAPAQAVAATVQIPVVGRIAAGAPLLAHEHLEGHVTIDASWLSHAAATSTSGHFALRVRGVSMQGAGILEGDYVIVRQQPTAENGDIVAARIDEEATVKRWFKDERGIRLQPEHPDMAPLLYGRDQPVEVLGKVVAVFRQVS